MAADGALAALAAKAGATASAASATAAEINMRSRFCRDAIVPQGFVRSPRSGMFLTLMPDVKPRRPPCQVTRSRQLQCDPAGKSPQAQSWLPVLSKTSALGSRRVESAAF